MFSLRPIAPVLPPPSWQPAEGVRRASTNIALSVVSHETLHVQEEAVMLARQDVATRQLVYRKLPYRRPILLGDHLAPRGELMACVTLTRVAGDQNLYQEPTEEQAQVVAVKKIRRVQTVGNEDPLCEISAMQALGDYQNVMGCIEALFDDEHLYIVMPWMCGGDLNSRIPPGEGLLEPEAQIIFKSIVSNLEYLQRNGVCHRDLKPENMLMTTDNYGNTSTLLIDMAMSRRVPVSRHGVVHPIIALGTCGTLPFMPPEIFEDTDFDGFKVDIWSLGITLFFMLTGQVLHEAPHDLCYKHFITHGGMNPKENDEFNNSWMNYANGLQERLQNMTEDALRKECRNHCILHPSGDKAELIFRLERAHHWLVPLLEKIHVVQNLSPLARDLLNGMLKANPADRLTLQEVRQHPWL